MDKVPIKYQSYPEPRKSKRSRIILTLFLLVCPYGTVKQKFQYEFKKGSSKKTYERRAYESVDERAYLRLSPEKVQKKEKHKRTAV